MPDIISLACRFLSAWNVGSEAIVDELAARDLVVSYTHFPQPLRGADAFKDALRQTHQLFPDLRITPEEALAAGEGIVVVRWRYRATHRTGSLFGVEAANTYVEVPGITIYRIRENRIHEESGVVDNLGLMLQLQGAATA
jgi:steroid delta-isomerase-like uncharacterized protein